MSKELRLPKISKGSIVGQIVEADYDGFKSIIEASDNIADVFAKVDVTLSQNIELGRDAKRVIDIEIKKLKNAEIRLRAFTTQYMSENKIKKLTGEKIKSITLQEQKTVKKTVSEKQMMVGKKYQPLAELSKDDLVEMLEKKGVKTRVVTSEIEEEKPAGIRVTR